MVDSRDLIGNAAWAGIRSNLGNPEPVGRVPGYWCQEARVFLQYSRTMHVLQLMVPPTPFSTLGFILQYVYNYCWLGTDEKCTNKTAI